jgi:membrane protein involved in colicin uptake
MPSTLTPITRTKLRSLSRLALSVAAISLLLSSAALAQTASGGAQNAKVQAAYGEWRQLSQSEVNCVDQSLKGQRTTLWALIQRGIHPSDSAVAKLRAGCRAQAKAPTREAVATQGVTQAAPQSGAQAQAAATVTTVESVPPRPAADKAVSEQALADRAAALAQAAEERAMANKAAAEKAAADKAAAIKAVADKVAAEKAAIETARVEAERAKTEPLKAVTEVQHPRNDADNAISETTLAYVASESRRSFFYGLVSSPICFALGGVVFLLVQRRRRTTDAPGRIHGIDETVLH